MPITVSMISYNHFVQYITSQEAESKLYSDYVPFVKVQKDFSNHTLEVPKLRSVPKPRTPSPLPDLTDEEISVIENATEDELVEVAGGVLEIFFSFFSAKFNVVIVDSHMISLYIIMQ